MTGKEFWLRWRSDIVRSVVILGVVFGIGLFVRSVMGHTRTALSGLGDAFDLNFASPDRNHGEPWVYSTALTAQHTLWLRNINGSITVSPADGKDVVIRAERSFKHSSVDSVKIITTESNGGLTVCAVWPGRSATCGPDGHFTSGGTMQGNDVAVVFDVRLPKGVRLDASTVNGDVSVEGASAPIGIVTVNGDVTAETAAGPVKAVTVNGDAHATIHGFAEPGDVNLTTVHGDVDLELPSSTDAVVDGHTVTGDISSEFPLTVSGKFASHSLTGTIGKGGRQIHITTVAGDVDVREAGSAATPVTAPIPPSPPSPRGSPRGTPRPHSGTS